MEELDIALQGMANLKSADESGIVIEMVKHAMNTSKENLISLFNKTLMDASFEDSWYTQSYRCSQTMGILTNSPTDDL